jgi:carbon storage regulator
MFARRVGETLVINDDITVTVLGINGAQIRVGINAPKNISVHRKEVYEKMQSEEQYRFDLMLA